jgi:hypothetical protein
MSGSIYRIERKGMHDALYYIVSGTIAGAPKPVEFRFDEVGMALNQAGILLKSGTKDVSIDDGRGHHIKGLALVRCCETGRIRGDLQPW